MSESTKDDEEDVQGGGEGGVTPTFRSAVEHLVAAHVHETNELRRVIAEQADILAKEREKWNQKKDYMSAEIIRLKKDKHELRNMQKKAQYLLDKYRSQLRRTTQIIKDNNIEISEDVLIPNEDPDNEDALPNIKPEDDQDTTNTTPKTKHSNSKDATKDEQKTTAKTEGDSKRGDKKDHPHSHHQGGGKREQDRATKEEPKTGKTDSDTKREKTDDGKKEQDYTPKNNHSKSNKGKHGTVHFTIDLCDDSYTIINDKNTKDIKNNDKTNENGNNNNNNNQPKQRDNNAMDTSTPTPKSHTKRSNASSPVNGVSTNNNNKDEYDNKPSKSSGKVDDKKDEDKDDELMFQKIYDQYSKAAQKRQLPQPDDDFDDVISIPPPVTSSSTSSKQPSPPPFLPPPAAPPAKKFKYTEVVRKKDERDALNGYECDQCRKFYEALGEGYDRSKMVQGCSRHRARDAAPDTPPDYWQMSFPSSETQDF